MVEGAAKELPELALEFPPAPPKEKMFEPAAVLSDFLLASPKVAKPDDVDCSVFLSFVPPKLKLGVDSETAGFPKLNESVDDTFDAVVVGGGAPNTKFDDDGKDADLAPNPPNELLLDDVVVAVADAVVELFPNEKVELEAVLVVAAAGTTDGGLPNEPKVAVLESDCMVFFEVSAAPKVKAEENEGLAATESVVVVGAMVVLVPNENVDVPIGEKQNI